MWLWAAFILFIFVLVALDLGIFHRRTRTIAFKEALILSVVWIGVALAFNGLIFVAYEHHWFGLDLTGDEPDGRAARDFVPVCTENFIRVDDAPESPKLAE
jgi:tellurite resistance protein TerC